MEVRDSHDEEQPSTIISSTTVAGLLFWGAAILSLVIALIVRWDFRAFPVVDVSQLERADDSVRYYLDNITNVDGYLLIEGWAAKTDENLDTVDCRVLLCKQSDQIFRCMKTAMVYRDGLAEAVGSEYNINNSGFRAYVDTDLLDEKELYQILLLYRNNGHNLLVDCGAMVDAQGEQVDG